MSDRDYIVTLMIPAELYVAFVKRMADLEVSKSHCGLDCINETLYREGYIDRETYQKFKERYRRKLVEVVKEKEKPSVKVEGNSEKIEFQKSTFVIKTIDYSKLSDNELLEAYKKAYSRGDIELQLIQWEARRRGYRFKADDFGNVQIINLKGEAFKK